MDYERYSQWVMRSFRWIRDPEKDLGLPHHVQLLGIVDAELRGIRREWLYDEAGVPREDEHRILLSERAMIQAHLWVLGVYEYVRMLDERLRMDPSLACDASIEAVSKTKHLFSRLRMPLAKLEPERRHKADDYQVPLPGIGPDGLGWQLNDELIVYQEQLSDAFMTMLCALKPRSNDG